MRAGAGVVVMLALAAPRVADACTCGGDVRVVPEDGAVGVPLNARVLVLKNDAENVALRRKSDGAVVPIAREDETRASVHYVAVLTRPTVALDPETTYEVFIPGFEGAGEFVSTFTTGTSTDDAAPAFAGATGLSPQLWRDNGGGGSSCWTRRGGDDQIVVEHAALGADVAGALIEVWPEADPSAMWRTLRPVPLYTEADDGAHSWIDSNYCSYTGAPLLAPDTRYCARVTAFDVAGNQAGAATQVCAASTTCRIERPSSSITADTVCDPTPFPPPDTDDGGCRIGPRRTSWPTGLLILALALALRRRR